MWGRSSVGETCEAILARPFPQFFWHGSSRVTVGIRCSWFVPGPTCSPACAPWGSTPQFLSLHPMKTNKQNPLRKASNERGPTGGPGVYNFFWQCKKRSGVARPSRGRVAQRQEFRVVRFPIRKRTSFLVVRRVTGFLCLTAPDRKSVGPPMFRIPEILAAHRSGGDTRSVASAGTVEYGRCGFLRVLGHPRQRI